MLATNFFDLGWWMDSSFIVSLATFAAIIVLQMLRARDRTGKYQKMWWAALPVAAIWGGIAIAEYLPEVIHWHEHLFLSASLSSLQSWPSC